MSSVMEQLQEQRRRFHEQGGGQPAATQPSGATASPTMDKLKAQRQEFLAKKAQEEQAQAQEAQAQAQWEQGQNEGSVVEKYGGQALRGMFRGGEKLMTGVADLVGADEFAENYESKAGRSSGSALERGSEYATPIPGLGIAGKAIGKIPKLGKAIQASTMGGAAARGAGQAGTYGAVTSDADTAVGKVIDAGQAAATGAMLGGVGHSVVGGLGKVGEAAKKSMARVAELGDSKISDGVLTLAKRADSDIGSKLAKSLAKTVNRGKRAHTARDRDQRYLDDIYQGEVRDTYKGIPGAVEAATKSLNRKRNFRDATAAAEKASNNYHRTPITYTRGNQQEYDAALKESGRLLGKAKQASQERVTEAQRVIKNKKGALTSSQAAHRAAQQKNSGLKRGTPEYQALAQRQMESRSAFAKKKADELNSLRSEEATKLTGLKDARNKRTGKLKPSSFQMRPVAIEAQNDAREVLRDTVRGADKRRAAAGRFTKANAEAAGNKKLTERMSGMDEMGFTPVKKPEAYKPASTGEMVADAILLTSQNPIAQGTAAVSIAGRGLAKSHNMLKKRKYNKSEIDKGNFITRVEDLPELPANPKVAEFLLGNTEAQKKYQELVASGNAKVVEDFVKRLSMRVAGNQDDAP